MTLPFRSSASYYQRNNAASHQIGVRPAVIETPNRMTEQGVAIMLAGKPLVIINRDAAFRVAKDMADIITNHRKEEIRKDNQ